MALPCPPPCRSHSTAQREALYWHYPHYGNQGGSPGAAIQQDGWKLIHSFEDNRNELYNLRQDFGEQHDLAAKEPERVEAMGKQLRAWQEEVGVQFPTPNPAME